MAFLLTKFIQLNLFFMGLLPLKVISYLAQFCFLLYKPIKTDAYSTTFTNLNIAFPGMKKDEIKKMAMVSLTETAKTALEMGFVWSKLPGKETSKYLQVKGIKSIKKSLDENKGLILIVPHLSNIEIILNYLGGSMSCMALYTPSKNKYFDKVMLSARSKMGVKMVETNLAGIKSILTNLKNGGVVVIASDQVPKPEGGVLSKFFTLPALTMTLVARLKLKSDAPCHSLFCIRKTNKTGFELTFSDKIDGMGIDLQSSVDRMNEELEKCIMTAPEQYSWEYKRYKHSSQKSLY